MKRLLAALAVSVSLSALAASEKPAVVVRVTDAAGLASAISQTGVFIGNPLLALPLAARVAENPVTQFFGPGRAGAATVLFVTVDPEKTTAASLEAMAGDLHPAVLYPVTKGKADFLAAHPDAEEKDGVIRVSKPKDAFVAFSADGAWAAMSDTAARAQAALSEVGLAATSLEGDLVQMDVTSAGVGLMGRALDVALRENAEHLGKGVQVQAALSADLLRQVKGLGVALRVDEAGLALRAQLEPMAGSAYAKLAPEPLPAGDALAFAGTDALYACAYAKDCGQGDFDASWAKAAAFVAKQGLDMSWLACTKQGAARTLTFDLERCVQYFATTGMARLNALDPQKVVQEAAAISEAEGACLKTEGPAGAVAFALKGADTKSTVSARFAKVAPEASSKKPYMVAAGSLYSAVRALAPKLVGLLPADEATAVQPLLQTLAPDGPGGMASYSWREGDKLKGVLRISPDEIKGLSTCFTLVAGGMMIREMKAMQMDASEDEGDED